MIYDNCFRLFSAEFFKFQFLYRQFFETNVAKTWLFISLIKLIVFFASIFKTVQSFEFFFGLLFAFIICIIETLAFIICIYKLYFYLLYLINFICFIVSQTKLREDFIKHNYLNIFSARSDIYLNPISFFMFQQWHNAEWLPHCPLGHNGQGGDAVPLSGGGQETQLLLGGRGERQQVQDRPVLKETVSVGHIQSHCQSLL